MTARAAVLRQLCLSTVVFAGASTASAIVGGCYSSGSGTAPPTNTLYYPVGMAVSGSGDYLYVVNSDFDLQFNGGTLQSYDLTQIREDTASLISYNLGLSSTGPDAGIFVFGSPYLPDGASLCSTASNADPSMRSNGQRTPLGAACAPPVDSTHYLEQFDNPNESGSAVIGAFATDMLLSTDGTRAFVPVRGDGTLTWATLGSDGSIQCGQAQNGGRCSTGYQAGAVPDPEDTRDLTMPGEPFAIAQTQDGTAITITQQATQETSLLLSGVVPGYPMLNTNPSMQFVLEGVPVGGDGIVAVPHDPDAVRRCEDVADTYPCVRPAFLETNHTTAEVDLLRYYDDVGSGLTPVGSGPGVGSSLRRPFLEREAVFPIEVNLPGTDERGIVIDDSPRLKCKALPGADLAACGQIPARVFIGSRSPASVIYGTIGGPSASGDGTYDPDLLVLNGSVPLQQGVSRLFLAPIVDKSGHYSLRLFVVCYDSSIVYVFDPDQIEYNGQQAVPEAVLNSGPGPYAMTFDPFCGTRSATPSNGSTALVSFGLVDADGTPSAAAGLLDCNRYGPLADVAVSEAHAGEPDYLVPSDPKLGASLGVRSFRFGYLTSFTQSYIQMIDLDDALSLPPSATPSPAGRTQETFETFVFTLGNPTPPIGS